MYKSHSCFGRDLDIEEGFHEFEQAWNAPPYPGLLDSEDVERVGYAQTFRLGSGDILAPLAKPLIRYRRFPGSPFLSEEPETIFSYEFVAVCVDPTERSVGVFGVVTVAGLSDDEYDPLFRVIPELREVLTAKLKRAL